VDGSVADNIRVVASRSPLQDAAISSLAGTHRPGEPALARTPEDASAASVATKSHHIPSLDGIRAGSFIIVFGNMP
jgi:ApbE superfamily uncharacterized protein (UPF0280 family)